MGLNERITELEAENVKLLNRLIARYISSDSQEK